MESSSDIISNKFDMLVERCNNEGGIDSFTKAERVIWFLISIRSEIDINGFGDVFGQLLSKDELDESITYLYELELGEVAGSIQKVVNLLKNQGYYDNNGVPKIDFYSELPRAVRDEIDRIGEQILANDVLWDIDPKLCELLK